MLLSERINCGSDGDVHIDEMTKVKPHENKLVFIYGSLQENVWRTAVVFLIVCVCVLQTRETLR